MNPFAAAGRDVREAKLLDGFLEEAWVDARDLGCAYDRGDC